MRRATLSTMVFSMAAWLLLACSCSNSKHLPRGERLFVGAKVNIRDSVMNKKERKLLVSDLKGLVRPKPNSQTLGIRLKLTIYNLAGDTRKKKGLRQWLRNKVGEPPVLANDVRLDNNRNLMTNYLENRGYFYSHIKANMEVDTGKKKARAVFEVATGFQYKIKEVHFMRDSSRIARDVDSSFNKTLLTPGAPYNLALIKAERNRIDAALKEQGYFYFKPDYVLVIVDSSIGNQQVNMYVKLKHREIPPEAYVRYVINDIYIYANYRLKGQATDTAKSEAVKVDSYYVIDSKKEFKPEIFSQAMIFEKGDGYSLADQNTSLSRLVNMGTFKFVKNRFEPVQDSLLDVYYYLTPYPRKSLRFEIGALTQNDNRAGTEGSISWKHRNAFKGAEQLLFKINGGFEEQYSGLQKQPNIYNLGAETDLSFPRFVVPFKDIETQSRYLPRSIIKLKYNYESESDLLRINSYTASFGYDWKEGSHKEHQLYPINFTYVKTDTFATADRLKQLLYSNLIFDGIIIGPTYEFTYNSQGVIPRKNSFYFDGLIDFSGNILGLAQRADFETNPKTLFGQRYAQYTKYQADFRYYLWLSGASQIATRLMGGLGIPYGNSSQLPNIKEFWAGGNSDLRGFPSRLVGPGTFNEQYVYGTNSYIETLGDIKIEANAELRQNLYKFLNAAIFFDAGNIWLYRNNPAFPGGQFSSNFYKELAVNTGVGLRFDFSILILRLDLGIPIRDPWLPDGDRWVFDKVDFHSSSWRKQNLIFNIGIGYPF